MLKFNLNIKNDTDSIEAIDDKDLVMIDKNKNELLNKNNRTDLNIIKENKEHNNNNNIGQYGDCESIIENSLLINSYNLTELFEDYKDKNDINSNVLNNDLFKLLIYYKNISKLYKKQLVDSHKTIKELQTTIKDMELRSWSQKKRKNEFEKVILNNESKINKNTINNTKTINKSFIYCEKINNLINKNVNEIKMITNKLSYLNDELKGELIINTLKNIFNEKIEYQKSIKSINQIIKYIKPDYNENKNDFNDIYNLNKVLSETVEYTISKNTNNLLIKCKCNAFEDNKNSNLSCLNEDFKNNCLILFQQLFDVKCFHSIPSRINDVYYKYGQLKNFKKSIIRIMDLEENCSNEKLTIAIQSLCNQINDKTSTHLKKLLNSCDFQNVVDKINIYDEYFPLFRQLLDQIMKILEISRLDQILPSIRALKILNGYLPISDLMKIVNNNERPCNK